MVLERVNTPGDYPLGLHGLLLATLWALCQSFHLQLLSGLEEGGQLVLGYVHLPSIHELQDSREMHEGDVLQDYYWVLGRVLFQQILEVGTAGAEDHLVGLGVLSLGGDGDVTEGLLVSQMLEGSHHVGLEVVPSQTKLLIVRHL